MSGSMSAAVRFEDHFGPIVPELVPPPVSSMAVSSTAAPTYGQTHAVELRDLVEQMHRSVVAATTAPDRAAKVESWESYRTARAEALGILASTSDTSSTPRLRSV